MTDGLDRSEPARETIDASVVIDILEQQRDDGRHDCAQAYVSLGGEPLLDVAIGESVPGRAARTDDVMLWYSSGKPLTTTAVLQLWEQGRLGLDDPVADYVDGWGNGKERCTLRHVLTHTGGFPMARDKPFDADVSYAETIRRIAAHPADWEPGTAASYHPVTGWKILGRDRRGGRRPADRPLPPRGGLRAARHDELVARDPPRRASRARRSHRARRLDRPPAAERRRRRRAQHGPYRIDLLHNEPWHIAKVEPGGGMRGPARELGRFYESLLGYGPPAARAAHRRGDGRGAPLRPPRPLFGNAPASASAWPSTSPAGPGGAPSARRHGVVRGLADPDVGLVMVLVCNGLPDPSTPTPERRHHRRGLLARSATRCRALPSQHRARTGGRVLY